MEQLISPNEVALLMATKEDGICHLRELAHVTDISGAYLRYICNSLSLRGYLEWSSSKGYQPTQKGKRVISQAIRRKRNWL